MFRRPIRLAVLALVAALAASLTTGVAGAQNEKPKGNKPADCNKEGNKSDDARCHAHIGTRDDGATPFATTTYTSGYAPVDLQGAYNLVAVVPQAAATIAIVDAFDNPNAESDLAVYRSRFSLPSCSTANGCFTKIDQRGGTGYPVGDVGWGQEIALDLDMASAICPTCKILLVEADSNSLANLGAAVNRAAQTTGVVAISNSYGAREFSGETSYEAPYNHPGIAVTVSSGDSGFGVEFPAASRYVTAVGGTSLTPASSSTRGWSESAWSGAGSGCSAFITTKPLGQNDTGCSGRTVADVSAVADPRTGVAVYDSYGSTGGANWYVFGGTSVSAPIIAAVYALSGNTTGSNGYANSIPYANQGSLFDVTLGSNGNCPRKHKTSTAYLCQAQPGYDGPTGLGTPNRTGAF